MPQTSPKTSQRAMALLLPAALLLASMTTLAACSSSATSRADVPHSSKSVFRENRSSRKGDR